MPFSNRNTQFKPGQSGNPGGRPKGSLTARLRAALRRPRDSGVGDKADQVIDTLIDMAITDRDFKALAYLYDRIDGKAPIVIADESQGALQVIIQRTEACETSTDAGTGN